MYWRDIALATSSRSEPLPNMNIENSFQDTLWRHRRRHHYEKYFLGHNQTFVPEAIPEVEYTNKIAISISDILSFW